MVEESESAEVKVNWVSFPPSPWLELGKAEEGECCSHFLLENDFRMTCVCKEDKTVADKIV